MLAAIPNPLDLLPDNITDSLNPLKWIADGIQGLYDGLIKLYEQLITNPPRPGDADWINNLNMNALGLSRPLIILVTMFMLMSSMLFRKRLVNAGHALLVSAVIAITGTVWFEGADWLVAFGRQLSESASHLYTPKGGHGTLLDLVPDIGNLLGLILGLGAVVGFGGILVGFILIYQLVIVFVTALLLPSYALTPLGERAQKWMNRLISLGLVSMVFGPAAAITCLEIGQWAVDTLPGGTTAMGATTYVVVAILGGIAIQVFLIIELNKVINKVAGEIRSNVHGMVNTKPAGNAPIDVRSVHADIRTSQSVKPKRGAGVRHEIRQRTTKKIVDGAVVLASRSHPTTAAAAAARRRSRRKPPR